MGWSEFHYYKKKLNNGEILSDDNVFYITEKIKRRLQQHKDNFVDPENLKTLSKDNLSFLYKMMAILKKYKKITSKQLKYIWTICPYMPELDDDDY